MEGHGKCQRSHQVGVTPKSINRAQDQLEASKPASITHGRATPTSQLKPLMWATFVHSCCSHNPPWPSLTTSFQQIFKPRPLLIANPNAARRFKRSQRVVASASRVQTSLASHTPIRVRTWNKRVATDGYANPRKLT